MMVALLLAAMIVSGPTAEAPPRPTPVVRAAPVVQAAGVGHRPPRMQGAQARLMAKRAAEVRAVRNLAGKLGRPQTTTIRGFRYVSTTYRADGSARVVVEYVKPRPSKPILIKKHQKMPHRRHWYRRIR